MPANVRDVYLVHLLRGLSEASLTAIVFTSSCRACEMLATTLIALNVGCAPLHSQQPQQRRLAAIGKLKQGSLRILIATDVAARGIDIPAVAVVVNHNVPAMPRDYVHRCGRTARAGRSGRAVTLVSQYDVELLLAIESHTESKLDPLEPDEAQVLELMNEVASARRTALLQLTDNGFLEKEKQRRAKRKEQREEAHTDASVEGEHAETGVEASSPKEGQSMPSNDTGMPKGESAHSESSSNERTNKLGKRTPGSGGGSSNQSRSHTEVGQRRQSKSHAERKRRKSSAS